MGFFSASDSGQPLSLPAIPFGFISWLVVDSWIGGEEWATICESMFIIHLFAWRKLGKVGKGKLEVGLALLFGKPVMSFRHSP